MNSYVASLIRTWVPIGVAALCAWLAALGIQVDDGTRALLASAIGGLAGAGYYALVRLIERKIPAVGVLLGTAVTPVYPALTAGNHAAAPTKENTVPPPLQPADEPGTEPADDNPTVPRPPDVDPPAVPDAPGDGHAGDDVLDEPGQPVAGAATEPAGDPTPLDDARPDACQTNPETVVPGDDA